VLGSNGAGKTTILKTISGIIDPRKGSIEFQGEDITAKDPAYIVQQGLSHVPEGREVFPLLSVNDNLLMGAYTRKDRDGVARDMEAVYPTSPSCANAPRRTPACSPAASSRCWRSRAPSWPRRTSSCWTNPAWACRPS
jgi:ABC-type branched-subunit amino acid transport system ATPase component